MNILDYGFVLASLRCPNTVQIFQCQCLLFNNKTKDFLKIFNIFFELELNLTRLQVRRLQRCLQFALHMSDDVVYLALCLQALRQIARKRDRHFNRREEDNRF